MVVANILAPLTNAEEWVLEALHSIGVGWGLAIVGLVVLVRLCTLPLVVRQFRSQRELREHMPEMRKLQTRHKDDKQRMQQELQAYYREHGINPLASFAPLLIQIPIFISLYYLMRQDVKSGLFGDVGFLFIPHLTEKPTGAVLVALITAYLASQIAGSLIATRAMKGGQKGLMLALPLLFVGIVARFPAGLAVYWITTSLWTLGQQVVMWRLQPNMAPTSLSSAMSMESGGAMSPDDLGKADAGNGGGAAPPKPPRKRKKKGTRPTAMSRALTDPWTLAGHTLPNRLVLAPLAGIGNWFVRLQARRYGAGFVVSEMVSSFGLKHGNERTLREFLRIHPDEHPVSMQLFGHDADVMREASTLVAEAGADIVDLNMGCPVRKVCKTGAGAALLDDPDKAVAIAKAAREGSGLPVTVKLRPGQRPGDRAGVELARRLVDEAGVSAIAFHPRHASQQHKGKPDYGLAAELVDALDVPVIISGGLLSDDRAQLALERSGAEAVMLARGSLGNPWRFQRLLGLREGEPTTAEVLDELRWIIDRAEEHLGPDRAGRYLRKHYSWYGERLALDKRVQHELVTAPGTADVRRILSRIERSGAIAQAA